MNIEILKDLIGEWFSVRSLSVILFYGTTCWLWIHGQDIPPQLSAIDAMLMTHFICTSLPSNPVTSPTTLSVPKPGEAK